MLIRGKFFIILILLGLQQSLAQDELQSKFDSLSSIFSNPNEVDTIRLDALSEAGDLYDFQDNLRSRELGRDLLELAFELNNDKYIANAYQNIGISFSRTADFDSAIYYLELSVKKSEEINNKRGILSTVANIAVMHKNLGQMEKAEEANLRALDLCIELEDEKVLSAVYSNLGVLYDLMGRKSEAITNHSLSLKLREKQGNVQGIAISNLNIGLLYFDDEDYDKAIELFHKCIEGFEEVKIAAGVSTAYMNIGGAMIAKGDSAESVEFFKKSLKIEESNGNKYIIASNKCNIAIVYLNQNKIDSAQILVKEATDAFNAINYDKGIILAEIIGGQINLQIGNFNEANTQFNKALELAYKSQLLKEQSQAANALYLLNKKRNNPAKALEFHELYVTLYDSLISEENKRELIRKEYELAYDKKASEDSLETEIANINLEAQKEINNKQSQQVIGLLLGLLITIILGGLTYNRYRLANKQKRLIELQEAELRELDSFKSSFFTNISHEFRTPLTVIKASLSMIKGNPEEVEQIQIHANRLLYLINQILELSELENGKIQPVYQKADIIQIANYIGESFKSLAISKDQDLSITQEEKSLIMNTDESKVQTILINLLSNAIKYTPVGGRIELETKTLGQEFIMSIRNSGSKIPDKELDKIFDRFYRLSAHDEQKAGSGLGLALCSELVNIMDGSIVAFNDKDGMICFQVSLPIMNREISNVSDSNYVIPKEAIQSLAIREKDNLQEMESESELPLLLIAEDEPHILNILVKLFKEKYNVIPSRDGREGLDIAKDRIPDIIISDIMMPEMDGLELTSSLKSNQSTSHIPIVLLTAKADSESRIEGLKDGADKYIAKPFDPEELKIQIDNLFKLQQKMRERFRDPKEFQAQLPERENKFISNLNSLLEENISIEKFGITELCEALGMSRTQLHRKLKSLSGQSTSNYINAYKLEKAKILLGYKESNISEVAYDLGYSDPAYFSRIFQKRFNISPSEFQKSI